MLLTEQLEILRRLDACTLANAIETFQTRLRNEGFVDARVRCMFPKLAADGGLRRHHQDSRLGATVRGRAYVESTDWWDYIQSRCRRRAWPWCRTWPASGSGSLASARCMQHPARWLRGRGDQRRRSRHARPPRKSGFQLFAGGVSVSHAYVHIVEFGAPVEIGGLKIQSGDLLHGDLHGVQSIPRWTLPPRFRRRRRKSSPGSRN
jgi:4-hydroxy-4-methyl-2-oxoglutarate aldolase